MLICMLLLDTEKLEKVKIRTIEKSVFYGYSLDCYDRHRTGVCYASFANDPRKCIVAANGARAKENAKLYVLDDHVPILKALRDIEVGEEILWNYGDVYFSGISQETLEPTPSSEESSEESYVPSGNSH